MKNKIIFSLALLMPACASIHPGTMARLNEGPTQLPLEVSADAIDLDRSSPFQLVQITFENTSNEWVRISKAEALTGDSTKTHISVVVGKDLTAWAEAIVAKENLERHNQELLQTGLAVAGAATAIAGAATGNQIAETAGLAVVVGTSAWAAVDVVNAKKRNANSPRLIPESHLYAETTVPPKMFIRRWILFNKAPGTLLPWVVFTVETVDSKKATYTIETERE